MKCTFAFPFPLFYRVEKPENICRINLTIIRNLWVFFVFASVVPVHYYFASRNFFFVKNKKYAAADN